VLSQKFLSSSWIFDAQLTSFLSSGAPMGLLDQVVTAYRHDDLNIL